MGFESWNTSLFSGSVRINLTKYGETTKTQRNRKTSSSSSGNKLNLTRERKREIPPPGGHLEYGDPKGNRNSKGQCGFGPLVCTKIFEQTNTFRISDFFTVLKISGVKIVLKNKTLWRSTESK